MSGEDLKKNKMVKKKKKKKSSKRRDCAWDLMLVLGSYDAAVFMIVFAHIEKSI